MDHSTPTTPAHPPRSPRLSGSLPGLPGRAGLALLAGLVAALLAFGISSRGSPTTDGTLGVQTATSTRPPGSASAGSASTAPAASVPIVTASTFPLPEALPSDPYAAVPIRQVGGISIPKLGVSATIYEGMELPVINLGAGHWPGTAMPGTTGNMVIAGYRTTYQKPFNRLDELVEGDKVTVSTTGATFTYEVRGVVIVDGKAIEMAEPNAAHTATLFACHPPGSAAQRIVAKLRLLDAAGRPVDPDPALPPVGLGTGPDPHTLAVASPSTQPGGAAPNGPETIPGG